jgi:hypothetical protein
MPQRIRDCCVAALALGAAFYALSLIDERVPEYMRDRVTDISAGRFFHAGTPVGNLVSTIVANGAVDNIFVMAMVAVAAVLLILMVRT